MATCSICFEHFQSEDTHRVVALPCGHCFGERCIRKWLKMYKACPTCKSKCTQKKILVLYTASISVKDNSVAARLEKEIADLKRCKAKLEAENVRAKIRHNLIVMERDMANRKCAQIQRKYSVLAKEKHALEKHLAGENKNKNSNVASSDSYSSLRANAASEIVTTNRSAGHISAKRHITEIENKLVNRDGPAPMKQKYRKIEHTGTSDSNNAAHSNNIKQDVLREVAMPPNRNIQLSNAVRRYSLLGSFAFASSRTSVMDGVETTLIGSDQYRNRNGFFHLCLGATGTPREFVDAGHKRPLRSLKLRSDLQFAVSTAMDGYINISSLRDKQVMLKFSSPVPAWSCDWNPASPYELCAGMQNGYVCIYDIRNSRDYVSRTKVSASNIGKPVIGVRYQDSLGKRIVAADISGIVVLSQETAQIEAKQVASSFTADGQQWKGVCRNLSLMGPRRSPFTCALDSQNDKAVFTCLDVNLPKGQRPKELWSHHVPIENCLHPPGMSCTPLFHTSRSCESNLNSYFAAIDPKSNAVCAYDGIGGGNYELDVFRTKANNESLSPFVALHSWCCKSELGNGTSNNSSKPRSFLAASRGNGHLLIATASAT